MSEPKYLGPGVIREFNDRSTLWLLDDPANLRDLLQLLEPGVVAALDFEHAQRVNRSFIPADLRKQESDLIFRTPTRSGTEQSVWVYLLLEHQSRPDPEMELRLLSYVTQLWESERRSWLDHNVPAAQRRLSPVVPIVLYTGHEPWTAPFRLSDLVAGPAMLARFVPAWDTLFLDLHRTPPEALTEITTAIGWALRVLQEERAPSEQLEAVLSEALSRLESLTDQQTGQWVRLVWYLLLMLFHRRELSDYTKLQETVWSGARRSKFRETSGQELTTMSMTMADYMRQQGEARGLRNGL
ncbi:MAG: putative transposase, partial [Armatimonadetes bacterium]|nr:putative transposase [Armatimonadota bacterium]